ncbi:MAG: glycoside hydrolase family 99-like domain-containing protein [Armatimonadetes bacterium]|nr:glycoside hydrolase family 99-like domain-containing protein [Armatimonadota bacterium]
MMISLCLALALPKVIVAHYMPWYQAKPFHSDWGWHWTMNHFNPDAGKIASQFHPVIGPYDSQDPDVIEYQLLTMKLAGIDGVFIDWYGIDDLWDYPFIHKASQMVFEETKKLGMKFGVVYEDQTLKYLIENKVVKTEDAVADGRRAMRWLETNWFSGKNYLRIEGKPALLVFGPQYYQDGDWSKMLSGIDVSFFTLHHRRANAIGGYDWPLPQGGNEGCEKERLAFLDRTKSWPVHIAGAYPRFVDIYKEAGVHGSWGTVTDDDGKTYRHTLSEALQGSAPVVQIATWNDWGEGTVIEPSKEFGYRDLEATQSLRKQYVEPAFHFTADDLRLPEKLFRRRKEAKADRETLDRVAALLAQGQCERARKLLNISIGT